VNEARIMLRQTGRHIPPLLAVLRDIMLADLDTSMGRPRTALRLLRNYRGGEFAIPTAVPCARAYLALNDLRGAQDCVCTVLATPGTQVGRFVLVEAFLCDAQIAQRSGELTILQFLATSMSTSEIADELCLSVNTVKTHVAAIYRKLPATRRRETVLRARQLELI
jgi:DNA-binding CsgD family transcriptional regulator